MSDMMIPTIEELTKRRMESLAVSEKAIIEHPDEYREIKKIIRYIISKTVDIGDYYTIAKKLTRLLDKMTESGNQSIFYYYYKNIDPQQRGQARYFRANCMDLEQQLKCVDQLRCSKRHIRVIQ
ncbi:MAG: hypothetical protein HF978_06840 [Desulfobacteraceae bacterium]|nr:hypothetical protein [Desulfobacteraceae bacterium]MBC2755249.1 hypothetical protein [Desulfobacteraceae bacterium]